MSELVVWADGRLRDPDAPLVAATDHGLTVGDGVFETCGVVDGQAFALTRHLERLRRSAAGLGLDEPDLDLVREGVAAVLAVDPTPGRVRITVTAGRGPLGSARVAGRQTVVVAAGPGRPGGPSRAIRVPWTRNERSAVAGLKTTSYAENVVALARATSRGADEALMANTRGALCEGTGSNVLVEVRGEVLTPSLVSGCLAGITRELVLTWAAEEGLPVREADVDELPWSILDDVLAGSATLGLCGSVRTVVPVVELDGVPVGRGDVLEDVCRMYARRAAEDVDP